MTITNPPRTGDLVDYLDQGKFRLTVGSTIVSLGLARFSVDRFEVSYDSKILVFSEVPTAADTPITGSFRADQPVRLDIDFGSGLTTYFKGRIRRVEHVGINNKEQVTYTAYGFQMIANELVFNWAGWPEAFAYGTEFVMIPGPFPSFLFGSQIRSIVSAIFSVMAADLNTIGIPATIADPGGIELLTGYIEGDLSFKNEQFVDVVKKTMSFEPNKRIFFDDTQQKWAVHNITSAPLATVYLSTDQADSFSYTEDLSNRYTAIQLYAIDESQIPATARREVALTPDWDSALESDWTIIKAQQAAAAQLPPGYAWVYRRWLIPESGGSDAPNPEGPIELYAKIDMWGQLRWVPILAIVDWPTRTVISPTPVVFGNAFAPNNQGAIQHTGPIEVVLVWQSAKYVPVPVSPQLRIPATLYEGTAYTQYGLERTKIELVDPNLLFTQNAQAKLDIMKDVIITGEIILHGDPIPELINLNRRVLVSGAAAGRRTGVESTPGYLFGYTYEFGRPGRSIIQLATDKSQLIRIR